MWQVRIGMVPIPRHPGQPAHVVIDGLAMFVAKPSSLSIIRDMY